MSKDAKDRVALFSDDPELNLTLGELLEGQYELSIVDGTANVAANLEMVRLLKVKIAIVCAGDDDPQMEALKARANIQRLGGVKTVDLTFFLQDLGADLKIPYYETGQIAQALASLI